MTYFSYGYMLLAVACIAGSLRRFKKEQKSDEEEGEKTFSPHPPHHFFTLSLIYVDRQLHVRRLAKLWLFILRFLMLLLLK